jgi:hypothetical protein
MKYISVCIFLALAAITSCVNNESNTATVDANEAYYQSIKNLTGLKHQPRMQNADSTEVIFYDNPDGDPKRYTRFYKSISSNSNSLIKALKNSVNKHFVRIEYIRKCRSEGKFYLFAEGNPMQTVYFSNRGDSCSHLYFIADGWFFYMDMDPGTLQVLDSLKTIAKKPEGSVM